MRALFLPISMAFPRLSSFPLLVAVTTLVVANAGAQTNVRDLNDTERKNIERAANLIEDVGKDLSKMADDCEKMLKEAENKGKVPKGVDPAKLREQLKQVHEEEDGWKAMADNIRQLLKDGKIKSGTLKNEKAVTEAGKQIVIDGRYLDTWEFDPDSEFSGLGKFQSLATLCEILVHEKTHYAITIKGEWLLERQFFISLFGDNALEWRPYIAGIHFLASLYKYTERSGGKKKDEKLKLLKGLIDQALKTFADAGGKTGKKFADELRELFKKLGILGMAAPRAPDQGPDDTLLANVAAAHVVAELGAAGMSGGRDALPVLEQQGTVTIQSVGTGETIGHIADLKIQNQTDRPINCVVPPMVLESKTRANQDYVCPAGNTVKINPHSTATVPLNGVCVNRNKPPVGKGVPGDLIVNTGDPAVPQNPDSHTPAKQARDLLRICTSKYDAAEKLQKDGALKDLPYKDKQKQKDIVVQWSTWCDPRISEITGAPPATKDDLRRVVYKQVEEQGPMTPETKKKVDQGIDTIFEKVELTTAKAKDLEKPSALFEGPVSTEKPEAFFKPGTEAKPATVAQPGDIAHVEDKPRGGKGHWAVKVKLPSGEIVEVWFETDEAPPLEFCNTIKINKTHTSSPGHNTVVDDYVKNPSPTPTAIPTATQPPTVALSPTPMPTSTSTATQVPTSTATQPPQSPPPAEKTEPEKPKGEAVTQPTPTEPPFELPDWLKRWWKFLKPGWEAAKTGTGMVPTDLPEGKDALGGVIAKLNVKIREECAKDPNSEKCEFYEKFRDKLVDIYNSMEDKD